MNRKCSTCAVDLPSRCFRVGRPECVWCQFADRQLRARWRFKDKRKQDRWLLKEDDFVQWYLNQADACSYCGVTFDELRRLQLPRLKGCYVSWDIDRIDSSRPYELGNLALACFICNIAKSSYLTADEARIVGEAVRKVYRQRLQHGSLAQRLDSVQPIGGRA